MSLRTPRSRLAFVLAATAFAAIAACGDDPVGPRGAPEIRILSGVGTSDTIATRSTQQILVQVRDRRGHPLAGVEVHFADAAPPVFNSLGQRLAFLLRGSYGWLVHSVVDTTDLAGRAEVWVDAWRLAGERVVEIALPAFDVVDTARFMVLPGAATGLALEPRDTIVMVGTTSRLRGAVHDRADNARADAITWRLLSGEATLDGAGGITMPTAGFARVEASSGGWADTAVVFGARPATLSGFAVHTSVEVSLLLLEIDGTRRRTVLRENIAVLGSDDRIPHWSPATRELYYQVLDAGRGSSSIWAIDTLGNRRPLLAQGSMRWQYRPQPSLDGKWIYFYGNRDPGTDTALWRARPDGSLVEGLASGRTGTDTDMHPAPSPDGTRIVFTSFRAGSNVASLYILELASGRVTPLGVAGYMPRWSPTGERIAYFDWVRDQLRVVDAGGANDRALGPSLGYPFSWSPDGRWIVGRGGNPGFVIVDANTGDRVRVPGSDGLFSPAWVR